MLSAREQQILDTTEQEFVLTHPWWTLRFNRLGKPRRSGARRFLVGVCCFGWVGLACVGAASAPSLWAWAVLAVGAAAFGARLVHYGVRRRARTRGGQ